MKTKTTITRAARAQARYERAGPERDQAILAAQNDGWTQVELAARLGVDQKTISMAKRRATEAQA